MGSRANMEIIREVINPDEQYLWDVTGSIADAKYNPVHWVLAVFTLGISLIVLYFIRTFNAYVLTNQRLIIIRGIFSKDVDEIELFRIVDSATNQSLVDRWANIGNIRVTSTDKTGNIVMEKIPSPYLVRDSLRQNYTLARQKKGTVVLESLAN